MLTVARVRPGATGSSSNWLSGIGGSLIHDRLRGLGTVLLGSLAVFAVAVLAGLLVGVATPTTQMLARASPSLLDAAVAVAAGMAGSYATARKDIPAALAGVAIAAALVPPIGAAGSWARPPAPPGGP